MLPLTKDKDTNKANANIKKRALSKEKIISTGTAAVPVEIIFHERHRNAKCLLYDKIGHPARYKGSGMCLRPKSQQQTAQNFLKKKYKNEATIKSEITKQQPKRQYREQLFWK